MYISKKGEHDFINVVVMINPMVITYLEQLLHTIDLEQGGQAQFIIVSFYSRNLLTECKRDKLLTVYNGRIMIKNYIAPEKGFNYLLKVKSAIKLINKVAFNYDNLIFYIAHPNHIITNYIYFDLSVKKNISIHQIPDGIANYYYVNVSHYMPRMVIKKIISIFIGIKYTLYNGHYLSGAISRFDRYYYFSTAYHDMPVELQRKINNDNVVIINNSDGVLIIGQDVSVKYRAIYLQTLQNIIAILGKRFDKINYRAHPAEKMSCNEVVCLSNLGCEIVDRIGVVEDIMGSYKLCIGFYSSALINARYIYGEKLELVTYDGNYITKFLPFIDASELDGLKSVFLSLNISSLEV
jgi:hypothetical protein